MLIDTLLQTTQKTVKANPHSIIRVMASLGPAGVFAIAIVDASFIPLPIPGLTDIMLIVLAARHESWILLPLAATVGSAIGAFFSHRVGVAGGVHMLEKRVSKKYFKQVCDFVQKHSFLAVAIPAFLPPPTPMSIFVLAAGALKIPRKKFMFAFTLSRAVRYSLCTWIGIEYGRRVLRTWNKFSAEWGDWIELALWIVIGLGVIYAGIYLWRRMRADKLRAGETVWQELAEDTTT